MLPILGVKMNIPVQLNSDLVSISEAISVPEHWQSTRSFRAASPSDSSGAAAVEDRRSSR
jgi:hypothetical protein